MKERDMMVVMMEREPGWPGHSARYSSSTRLSGRIEKKKERKGKLKDTEIEIHKMWVSE
jgi:hypothetical protein